MRCFIALEFDENLIEKLSVIQGTLRSNFNKGNWVRKENYHLTVKFLGEIEQEQVNNIERLLENISLECYCPSLSLGNIGYFNKRENYYGVVWVGLEGEVDKLKIIYNQMEEEMYKLGFEKEKRKFFPHITLGRRISITNMEFCDIININNKNFEYNFQLNKISLMKSEEIMGRRVYTSIKSYKLKS
jgi:2'-5' RNA ligase